MAFHTLKLFIRFKWWTCLKPIDSYIYNQLNYIYNDLPKIEVLMRDAPFYTRHWLTVVVLEDTYEVLTWLLVPLPPAECRNPQCKPGFSRIGRWCFSVHTDPASRNQSLAICQQTGGSMVVLDSAEKEQALTSYITGKTNVSKVNRCANC